ncbi:hypothetical protein DBR32_02650 [Taibaiella sp. KBW10]|uniref:T9SS type A sorting domain-containing protein n=1 Tax=Taibaiella sp. KBW10 TaxID=2153357 RepID=UPI000F5A6CD0|nr:T9SS type A sorting domain-containing protein [Taibaiella sp. KBW10]RQO32519.1 hypothetical protein DBR32_02650 [Taibaiella sp. KBW10]
MKTSLYKKASLLLAILIGIAVQSNAQVSYNVSPIASTNGYTLNTKITITGIDVITYYGPGSFQYNIKLNYANTITGTGNSGNFYAYEIKFYKNSSGSFQSAQSTSSIPVATASGSMTSYGPNSGTSTLVTGTGLYTNPNVINEILTSVGLAVNAPGIPSQTAGSTPATIAPLPVSLESFTAQNNNGQVSLKWLTVSEHNNKGFAIESSTNARDWHSIGFVNSLAKEGNSTERLAYTFTATNVTSKTYYRLQQTDNDGTAIYSAIVMVSGGATETGLVSVYPNPATGNAVTVDGIKDANTLSLYNAIGQQQKVMVNSNSGTAVSFSLDNLSNGVYYISADQKQYKIIVNK